MRRKLNPSLMVWQDLPLWTRRAGLAVVSVGLVLLLLFALAYRALWLRYDGALAQLEPRIERLDGLLRHATEIDQRLTALNQQVQPWMHPGGAEAQNAIAQRLREWVVASGGTLVSSQAALTPAEEGQGARVRLSATVSGDWDQLMGLTETLQNQLPPLWLRSLNLMREGGAGPDQPQKARLVMQLDAPLAAAPQEAP